MTMPVMKLVFMLPDLSDFENLTGFLSGDKSG
jgi:hypothetical protein